jgi:hypothetical protein
MSAVENRINRFNAALHPPAADLLPDDSPPLDSPSPHLFLDAVPFIEPASEPAPAHLELIGPSEGRLQTYSASNTGNRDYADPLIDQEGNRAVLERAWANLKARFAEKGQILCRLWPMDAQAEVQNADGSKEVVSLWATDPEYRAIKKIYAEAKGGKDGKESLYDLSTWTRREQGLRGNGNGPTPLQKGTERLSRDFDRFTNAHLLQILAPCGTRAEKVQILRRLDAFEQLYLAFLELLRHRREALSEKLSQEADLGRKQSIEREIESYDRVIRRFDGIDDFALTWGLAKPLPLNGNILEHYRANVAELERLVEAKLGNREKAGVLAHALPFGSALKHAGQRTLEAAGFERLTHDQALQPQEKDYIRDVAALGISDPANPDNEQQLYNSIVKAEGMENKTDSLELAFIKTIKAIDSGMDNPGNLLAQHPLFNAMIVYLSPGEQATLRQGIRELAQQARNRCNHLKPSDIPFPPGEVPIGEGIRLFRSQADGLPNITLSPQPPDNHPE